MTGFALASEEITLVLFTTLAPAGAVAYVALALISLRESGKGGTVVQRFMLAPLLVVLLGLVASATHLGNPENALYVLSRVGKSPLSNEVLAAVAFLGCAGIAWMYQFAERCRPFLLRMLVGLSTLLALGLVVAISFAYASRTILTWNTPLVPLAQMLNALLGGALLAYAVLRCAKEDSCAGRRFGLGLVAAAAAALVASTVVYVAQDQMLDSMGNYTVSARQLVPGYIGLVGVYGCLGAAGLCLDAVPLARGRQPSVPCAVAACLLGLTAIFIMRFAFYMMHLTVGMSW